MWHIGWHIGWQTFSVDDRIVTIFGLVGHVVSVTATQLCHRGMKAATDDASVNARGYVSIKLYLQEKVVAGFGLWAAVR